MSRVYWLVRKAVLPVVAVVAVLATGYLLASPAESGVASTASASAAAPDDIHWG